MTFYKNKDFVKQQKEWYAKLKEEGFDDIEGGMEGHLLQQKTPTLSLGAALQEMPERLHAFVGWRKNDPKGHERWLDSSILENYDRGKSRYYDVAQHVATRLFLTNANRNMKFSWSMHSDGYGEEVIAGELQLSRSKIRRFLGIMKKRIKYYLDNYTGD